MLYEIKDKRDVVLGVHECEENLLGSYLRGLPEQSSPYTTKNLSPSKKSIRTKILEHLYYRPAYLGLVYGLAVAAPAWGYVVYKTLGGH